MKNKEIPEQDAKFIKHACICCDEMVQLYINNNKDLKMGGIPPILFLYSDKSERTLVDFETNLLHDDFETFKAKAVKLDKDLMDRGFNTIVYVAISESRMKVVKQESVPKGSNFKDIAKKDFRSVKADAEFENVLALNAFGIGYSYLKVYNLDTGKTIVERVNRNNSDGKIAQVYSEILLDKIKI